MPMNHNENPCMVDEEYLSFIGSATVVWSGLDVTLQILIWKLLNIDSDEDKGLSVTNHMPFNGKIHLAKTLVNVCLDRGEISKTNHDFLLEDIQWTSDLSQDRNKIMHGYFYVSDTGDTRIDHVAARGNINRTMHFKTLDNFRHFINAVSCASDNIYAITCSDWLGSQPEERHES